MAVVVDVEALEEDEAVLEEAVEVPSAVVVEAPLEAVVVVPLEAAVAALEEVAEASIDNKCNNAYANRQPKRHQHISIMRNLIS